MNISMSRLRKINLFLGREPYALFNTTKELEEAHNLYIEHLIEADEKRFEDALKNAPRDARVVTKTWPLNGKALRKGEVIYIKNYPQQPMITRTRGSMQGQVDSTNWKDINEHTIKVRDARNWND